MGKKRGEQCSPLFVSDFFVYKNKNESDIFITEVVCVMQLYSLKHQHH